MTLKRTYRRLAVAALAALAPLAPLAAGLPASAQETAGEASAVTVVNGQTFGAWTVACQALGVNRTSCVLSQRLVRRADNAFLAEILAFTNADDSKRFLAARVPNGVYLPAGFALRPADSEDETRFVWQSCSARLCEALVELTPELARSLEGASGGLIAGYRPSLQSESVIFAFSAEGLTAGLDALAQAAVDAR